MISRASALIKRGESTLVSVSLRDWGMNRSVSREACVFFPEETAEGEVVSLDYSYYSLTDHGPYREKDEINNPTPAAMLKVAFTPPDPGKRGYIRIQIGCDVWETSIPSSHESASEDWMDFADQDWRQFSEEVLSLFGKEATNPYKGPRARDMYVPTIEDLVAKYAAKS